MKPSALPLALALLAMPLGAQDAGTPQGPTFLELRLTVPSQGLKDQVGNANNLGLSVGYDFQTRSNAKRDLCHVWAVRMDLDEFENNARQTGAYSVGVGVESTQYFQARPQGTFLSVGLSMCDWSITDRTAGQVQNTNYLRPGVSIAVGYRFQSGWSLAAQYRVSDVDPKLTFGTYGLALRHTL